MNDNENTETRPPGWYSAIPEPGYERFWTGTEWGGIRPSGFMASIPVFTTDLRSDLRPRRSRLGKRLAWLANLFRPTK